MLILVNYATQQLKDKDEPSLKHQTNPEEHILGSDEEARALIKRLDNLHREMDTYPECPNNHITVEDIAEALHLPVDHVLGELNRMRAEDSQAHFNQVLRELEEPLHRVERPGTAQSDRLDPIFRTKTVTQLMERAQQKELPRRKVVVNDSENEFGHKLGRFMIFLLFGLMIFLVAWQVLAR